MDKIPLRIQAHRFSPFPDEKRKAFCVKCNCDKFGIGHLIFESLVRRDPYRDFSRLDAA